MTTYNTYQEAKIAMPKACICVYKNNGKDVFIGMPSREGTTLFNGSEFAEPQDYCMTVEKFLADGHEVFMGDAIINTNGNVNYITQGDAKMINSEGGATFNNARYILRAAALEDIPTETPEEKEVLDCIESAGEVEWKNGDDVDVYGKLYKYVGLDPFNENLCICLANQDDDPQCFSIDILKKPETPQQRKDRERLEAAYDLYVHIQSVREKLSCKFDWFFSPGMEETRLRFLAIVDKTNYRKEKAHGTN